MTSNIPSICVPEDSATVLYLLAFILTSARKICVSNEDLYEMTLPMTTTRL